MTKPPLLRLPPALLGQAAQEATLEKATFVGFDCPVQRPIDRTGNNAGLALGFTDGLNGPAILISVCHPDGQVQTARIDAATFPGFMHLMNTMAQRMANAILPTPGDKAN